MRWSWLSLCLLVGCSFRVGGLEVPLAEDAGPPPEDLAVVGDGPSAIDAAGDSAMPSPDMAPQFTVAHVPQHFLTDASCDLTVTTGIDTTALTVDGTTVPAACAFTTVMEDGTLPVAVLAVHSFTASNITVTGSVPLVIVATTTITIDKLDASAKLTAPGPGGYAANMGPGAGANGSHTGTYSDSGGGGGGYATVGGAGGNASYMGDNINGGNGGVMNGTADLLLRVAGGSGGGKNSSEGCATASGGAGGGSIQLTAGNAITISMGINVGGGGGTGGCRSGGGGQQGSGGGGGAGGAIYLESRSINVSGGLYANGGGGGGGGSGAAAESAGGNGGNGQPSTAAAVKGTNGGMYGEDGALGGTATAPLPGDGGFTNSANAGGGGGSAGRIVVRSHGAATVANYSPIPLFDTSVVP